MKINPLLLCDFYKVGHVFQYPDNTTLVYSNLTPRKSRISGVDKMVFFGLQYFIKEYLINQFNENFFKLTEEEVVSSYLECVEAGLGKGCITVDHIISLHNLQYLPITIKAIPEGRSVNMGTPVLTIINTNSEFYWIPNFLETILSTSIWQACTSATIAKEYKKIFNAYATKTTGSIEGTQWQGHDFSMRGMSSLESACLSGAGHLLSFTGTDTIPAIKWLQQYYNADLKNDLVGGSVPATEHSVMCAGEKEGEIETFKRLITEIYPKGIVSIVSDTWDLWKVCTEYLPALKDIILSREGKVVIRPDSGDPVDIICGKIIYLPHEYESEKEEIAAWEELNTPECKGVIELLWDVFGGTINDKGYKVLDSHIGAIYGDSITPERATKICQILEQNGFASTNIVFGIGSFTYQYNTRDTFSTAMKATYVAVDGIGREIYKDPITGDGMKKSARGLLNVTEENRVYKLNDRVSWSEERAGALETVFCNGKIVKEYSLSEIRENILLD